MSTIQYLHRRAYSALGPASRGGYTVAYCESSGGMIEYSIANCSPRDNFNKKIGRDIATGRFQASKRSSVQATVTGFRDMIYASEPT